MTTTENKLKIAALAAMLGAVQEPLDEAGEGNQFDVSTDSLNTLLAEGDANETSAQFARDLLTAAQAVFVANGISQSSVTAKRVTGHIFSAGGAFHQALEELVTKASDADAAEQEDPTEADPFAAVEAQEVGFDGDATQDIDFSDYNAFGGCGCSKALDI